MSKKATYLALTTINYQTNGFEVLVIGHDKAAVKAKAEELIGDVRTDYGTDIYADTKHKNLIVVSKSYARRKFGINLDEAWQWGTNQPEWMDGLSPFRLR